MKKDLMSVLPDPKPFLDQIFLQLKMKGIFVLGFEMDHLCYRVETEERYENIKAQLHSIAELLVESTINGRNISVFKLHRPIRYETRDIYLLELPAPKENSPYHEGYEHVEFVVDMPLDQFVDSYPHIDFDTKGMSKLINRDARVQLNQLSVKFHENNLEEVILYEKTNQ